MPEVPTRKRRSAMSRWMMAALLASCAGAAGLGAMAEDEKPARPQGQWVAVEYDQNAHRLPADMVKKLKVAIRDDKIVIKPHVSARYRSVFDNGKTKVEVTFSLDEDASDEVGYKLDPAKGRIDLVWSGGRGES